ncbi:hypothetical protein RhiirC2_791723 [Rhizophagus irregularis]|uniref:BAH domain-containing protein n=1 Tax=Rhizophagus irregularis TaxID=588596 RepID=A0A2N1MIM0_9GLOM|nr:hypothetical protein RhiirC2_791723 [Rhizophagus irregularis]
MDIDLPYIDDESNYLNKENNNEEMDGEEEKEDSEEEEYSEDSKEEEYSENSEEKDNNDESDDNDETLNENRMPVYNDNNEFTPYFENYTTASLFCWLQKHNISTNAYEDLVDILQNPKFKPIHAITYQLSINDIIWYVLNNPSLIEHMYFGPDVYSEIKSEFWHGTLWGESPLLGKEEIIISEMVYKCGDFIYYYNNGRYLGRLRAILRNENDSDNQYVLRVQKTLDYDHLPGNFKGSLRQSRSHKEHQYIPEDTLQINEIIYKHNGHWCIRDAKFSYQHPADYIKLKSSPPSMKVYKLFLDLYFDDFGMYRNVYHSLEGIYLQFENMPAYMRKQIKNHFVLGFVPFGGEDSWIIASLSVITADLPQGNNLTGVLRHGANKGCRTCTIKKELLTDYNQDIVAKSRYHHITNEEITKISQESVISIKNQLGTKYGLRLLPNILDQLKREKHLQTPQDIYHSTAGKISRLLKITCELFSQEGKENFIKIWKDFEKPKKWSRLPNPINHHASFMMSDYLRIAMIIPYILYRFLKISSLKENGIIGIQQRINAPHNNLIIKSIISCWVHVAKTMKAVFNSEFTADEYNNLQKCLQDELIILSKVFASFENLPN